MHEDRIADPKEQLIRNFRFRFYRGIDYLTLFLYVGAVAVGAVAVDYGLVHVIELTLEPAISSNQIVAQFFDWFQIGSAFLVFVAAFIHALFSAISQIRFEWETNRSSES